MKMTKFKNGNKHVEIQGVMIFVPSNVPDVFAYALKQYKILTRAA